MRIDILETQRISIDAIDDRSFWARCFSWFMKEKLTRYQAFYKFYVADNGGVVPGDVIVLTDASEWFVKYVGSNDSLVVILMKPMTEAELQKIDAYNGMAVISSKVYAL